MDEKERMKRFENALSDIEIAKFAPDSDPTLAALVEQIRGEVRRLNAICDDIERVINSSVDEARKAADSLIELTRRVK
jgi:hypothetical protein